MNNAKNTTLFPYLERLLEGEAVEWKTLGDKEYISIENNARKAVNSMSRIPGKTPYYGANNIQDYVEGYTHDGVYILIAEDGTASVEQYSIQWAEGKFWANNHVHVIKGTEKINNRFLYYFLKTVNYTPFLKGGGRAKLTKAKLQEIPFAVPPLRVQARIVEILDKFTQLEKELEAELEARKKQYAYYRDQLLNFSQCPPLNVNVKWKALGEICDIIKAHTKLKTIDYKTIGKTPIIDQGAHYIAGYTDKDIPIIPQGEYILFGDHTECIKYVNFEFVQGADGLKILQTPKDLAKYIYYAFSNFYRKSVSYKRHWSQAKETLIPIPPLSEQRRIVDILDRFDTLINSISEGLPKEIALRRKQYEYYRDALLSFPRAEVTA